MTTYNDRTLHLRCRDLDLFMSDQFSAGKYELQVFVAK